MKAEIISARFQKEETAMLEQIAKEEKTDKTTALRKIFALGAKQYALEKAVREYQTGKAGTAKAAEIAGITLWEMMEELNKRNIANPLTQEDYKEGLKNIEKAWKR